MANHAEISRRVTAQTPFASMRTSYSAGARRRAGGTSRSYTWIGRITFCWREADQNGRVAFLYDVEPLVGGPRACQEPTVSRSKGAKAAVVKHVRLMQPYCGNIFNSSQSATGIIIVPEAGALVEVGEDPHGWIIIGFLSGPSFPLGNVPKLAESTQNPGFEELSNTLYQPAFIARLFDLTEGDIVLGRGLNRVRFSKEGLYVGSTPGCSELFRADGLRRYSRYANWELRGPAHLGYKRTFLGLSGIEGYTADQSTVHTDVIDLNPDVTNLVPYVVRQVGHVSSDHLLAGKYAGELEPSPMATTIEQETKQVTVIRESVIQPITPPTGTSADCMELNSTSGVVYDFQVRGDGSFHIRSGKTPGVPTPGISKYGIPTDNTLDVQFDALTNIFKLRLGVKGAPLVNIIADGNVGTLTVLATASIALQAPSVLLPLVTNFISPVAMSFTAPTISLNAATVLNVNAGSLAINGGSSGSWVGPNITVPGDVVAGAISLLLHSHNYLIPAVPAPAPPNPGFVTPPVPGA